MLADAPKCKVLGFVYDYTTRYRMDMPLNTDKKYLVNQFLRDSIVNPQFFDRPLLAKDNPCNINPACLIPDDTCASSGEVTVGICTLSLNNMIFISNNIVNDGFIELGVEFTGETGTVTYLWDFPLIDDSSNIEAIITLQSAITLKTTPTIKIQFNPLRQIPLQTIINITCTITDDTGCTSTLTCPIVYEYTNFTLYCDFPEVGECPTVNWQLLNITSTAVTIVSDISFGAMTVDVELILHGVNGDMVVFNSYGQVDHSVPYTLTGLNPNTDFDVVMTIHCPDGSLQVQSLPFTTLP